MLLKPRHIALFLSHRFDEDETKILVTKQTRNLNSVSATVVVMVLWWHRHGSVVWYKGDQCCLPTH